MLRGEEIDERSGYELRQSIWKDPLPVTYNPAIPIETFDFIIADTARRGSALDYIQQRWKYPAIFILFEAQMHEGHCLWPHFPIYEVDEV